MARYVDLTCDEAQQIICYPTPESSCLSERIHKLKLVGVKKLLLNGNPKDPVHLKVLGVGHAGVVVKALWNNMVVALKIRRVDSKRETLEEEAKLQKLASTLNVAPKVYAYNRDFIIMEYIDGIKLVEWLRRQPSLIDALTIIKDIIEKCRKLDVIGLDHGELSRAKTHILIGKGRVYIIDYESASTRRKPKNLTSICAYLFMRDSMESTHLRRLFGIDKAVLRELLKAYKENPSEDTYHNILNYILANRP